ncbi:kelch-like protein 9 [Callorhinchus milii]|uniref:Kelch-like protein 9 n=2 Tax=Callorhinchus milii TaxID=7868 RepID=A0A4W3GIY7_CALMI|nr:kelch-like protein 9 [Callorhinchus milii]|eukprot:gi/632956641/ref/XP_007894058.1/ PREDICTED: kelch-like protein 9 [Callorhinchus milii]
MPLKWKLCNSPSDKRFLVSVLKASQAASLSPTYISLLEEDTVSVKVSVACNRMGVSTYHQPSTSPGSTQIFSSEVHSATVLEGFNNLRTNSLLCDVTLVPEDGDERFPVHRAMMASASDYFNAMFTGGMKEQELMTIKLHGVSGIGLKNIIEFIYTAKMPLNMDNLQDTLEAASFLQIMPILEFCKELLISQVCLENCVEIGRIASSYHLSEVDDYIKDCLLKNFANLLSNGDYIKLSYDQLAFVLSSDSLQNCPELELFKAACQWLKQEEGRMQFAAKLMKNIRFPLMSPQQLLDHVQKVEFMRTDTTCVNLLLEASNYQMLPYMQPVMQSERTQIRSDETHLVTLGGVLRQQLLVSKELRLFDEKSQSWKSLAAMDVPRYQHGVAVIGNFLFVVGGQSNYDTKGKTAVDTTYRYDPRYNKWKRMGSLNEKRTFFHLSALKGHLYAVGGRNVAGELATVECYNPATNEWTYVTRMSEPHYGHAGTVHGKYMYISGGITHDTFQRELQCYDPETDSWSQKTEMSTVRGLHCMCTIGDRLYVIGGNHFRGTNDYDDVLSCEYYCPAVDDWTAIAPMLRGQSDVGVAVFQDNIYVIGGYSWNNRCMVEIVQKYDPQKDEWEKVFDVPESLGGIRACTLTVHMPEEETGLPSQESPLVPPDA